MVDETEKCSRTDLNVKTLEVSVDSAPIHEIIAEFSKQRETPEG